ADREIMLQDLGVYVTALNRVLNAQILPYDFRPVAEELREGLEAGRQAAGDAFALDPVSNELDSLEEELQDFHRFAGTPQGATQAGQVNRLLIELSRRLVPVNYARGERFDHDPAQSLGIIPKLEQLGQLARLAKGSDEWRFQEAELIRQRNKVANTFYETASMLRTARKLLGY
ncbi:MAG: hypothetical protein V3T83_18735, partial [Acidobacteriota bacterium]